MRIVTPLAFALVFLMLAIPMYNADVFGHGNPGVDRAPAIDFENKNVTVRLK